MTSFVSSGTIATAVAGKLTRLLTETQQQGRRWHGVLREDAYATILAGVDVHPLSNTWIAALPEQLFFWLWPDRGAMNEPPVALSDDRAAAERALQGFCKSATVAHTLSPAGDSAAIVADLGRFARVSSLLKLPKRVLLAGPSWTSLNWVVRDLHLEQYLHASVPPRMRLYAMIGCNADDIVECTAEGNRLEKSPSAAKTLAGVAYDLAELAKLIYGEDVSTLRFTKAEVRARFRNDKIKLPVRAFLQLALVRKSFDPLLEMMTNVAEQLHRVDANTFTYFLLQWYHQSFFQDSLKVTVKRELSFDQPFQSLNSDALSFGAARVISGSISGIYHDDYYFGRGDAGDALTVQPYYFPSGTLYRSLLDACGATEDSLTDAHRQDILSRAYALVPMLGEGSGDGARMAKLRTSLTTMKPFDRARFMADTLSFVSFNQHLGFVDRIAGRVKSCGSKAGSPSWVATELVTSLRQYTIDDIAAFASPWIKQLMVDLVSSALPPAFLMPFAWELAVLSTPEQAEQIISFEAEVLAIVLEEVEDVTKHTVLAL